MSEQDETRIAEAESRIEALFPRMDSARDAIVRTIADALAAFWPGYVSECVRASGDALAELAREEVARIKAEVAAVTEDPEAAARDSLAELDWPHERDADRLVREEDNSTYTESLHPYEWRAQRIGRGPTRAPSRLDAAVGQAAAAPAHPLRAAGLEAPRTSSTPGKPPSAWGFTWTDEMFEAADAYGDLVGELQQLVRDLREALRSRHRNDAQAVWDSV
jgi:hypothetical protein